MLKQTLHEVRFAIGKSLRYHAKRRSFFEMLHRASMAFVAVGGSAAFASVLGNNSNLAIWSAFIITILATLDAAIGYSQKAREYDSLFKRFADLSIAIEREAKPSADFFREIKAKRILIEKDEPTELSALNVICHNEQAEAMGCDVDSIRRVRIWQRWFAHFLTLPPNKFPLLQR